MSELKPPQRGMYFEEFEVGQRIVTPARTVTEADIVTFAGLSGDFTSIHTDSVHAEASPFEQRVAHGLLGLSIASGLAVRTGILEGTVLAFREINDWKFSLPIYIGDTIHVELEVDSAKAMPRLGGGLLQLVMEVHNQRVEMVMKGRWSVLIKSQPTAD
ncbi:MAG: MaoC/PaaZ C-terminal domain-containing protein [Anaerolineales bacterium]